MRIKILVFFIIQFLIISCEDDIEIKPSESQDKQSSIVSIQDTSFKIDSEKSLILYNGSDIELDSLIKIGNDTYKISPRDLHFETGKPYKLTDSKKTYTLFRSDIPIVSINSKNQEIVDEPKRYGIMTILKEGEKTFEGEIGIEIRGNFSQRFPKKSYGVELWQDPLGDETQKTSLLGMREDDDWLLDALWNEPLRIRDYTSHDFWLEMGRFDYKKEEPDAKLGIAREYCEVFVNGAYRGVYYLGEKIDRKQLEIKKNKDGELRGELYKNNTREPGIFFSGLVDYSNSSETWNGYEAEYPDDIGELNWENLHGLVDFVVNSDKKTFDTEIENKMYIPNMVDYFIFMNVIFIQNNTGKNLYTAKYNLDRPYFIVPWDFDGSYGNFYTGDRFGNTDKILGYPLYNRLLNAPIFVEELKSRWSIVRKDFLDNRKLHGMLRHNFNTLKDNGVYAREAMFEDLPFKGKNGEIDYKTSEMDFIDSWLDERVIRFDLFVNSLLKNVEK